MNRALANQYADYDNTLCQYFDQEGSYFIDEDRDEVYNPDY